LEDEDKWNKMLAKCLNDFDKLKHLSIYQLTIKENTKFYFEKYKNIDDGLFFLT
jgi:coproporphyrinogen III oxidase-like Fe-S oxidoreductase